MKISIFILFILITACSKTKYVHKSNFNPLINTEWKFIGFIYGLDSIIKVDTFADYSIKFIEKNRVISSAKAICSGVYEVGLRDSIRININIHFSGLYPSKPEEFEVRHWYRHETNKAKKYLLKNNNLILYYGDEDPVLYKPIFKGVIFERKI